MSPLERLQISPNHRFLITTSGKPFFWLGDTAWELFHRSTLEEADHYLENRRQKGFNVIQAVVLAECDGVKVPNPYGELPLLDLDPTRPNEAYFKRVDAVVRAAATKGIYIGMLPTWGDKVNPTWGPGPVIFNPVNARVYGRFIGDRYKNDTNIIWIQGGDRSGEGFAALWEEMSEGIKEGCASKALFTYHPTGGQSSSTWFHTSAWLDFNMIQSGHMEPDAENWAMLAHDYNLQPDKPTLDGEPNYEDHPINPFTRKWVAAYGRFNEVDVRKQAYRAVFAGAVGHTYGHHSIWQWHCPRYAPVNYPMYHWYEAINRPGSAQMIHLKNLVLSRPYLERIPDQSLLVSPPEDRPSHIQAARSSDGSYAFIYVPTANQALEVRMSLLSGDVFAWWYDPRNGTASLIGEFSNQDTHTFVTPDDGPDWVLGLDVKSYNFPLPERNFL